MKQSIIEIIGGTIMGIILAILLLFGIPAKAECNTYEISLILEQTTEVLFRKEAESILDFGYTDSESESLWNQLQPYAAVLVFINTGCFPEMKYI